MRHVQSFADPQDYRSIFKVERVTVQYKDGKKNKTGEQTYVCVCLVHTVCVHASNLLQYSHIGLHGLSACSPPVLLEAHHKNIGLHAAHTRSLREKKKTQQL